MFLFVSVFFISGGNDVLRLKDFVLFEFVNSTVSVGLFVDDVISIFKDFLGFVFDVESVEFLLSFSFVLLLLLLLLSFSLFIFELSLFFFHFGYLFLCHCYYHYFFYHFYVF